MNINDTELWGLFAHEKRKLRCVEQESGVCYKVSEAGEQQLVTNKKPGHVLCTSLGVISLVLREEIINKGDLGMCICVYLMIFTMFYQYSGGRHMHGKGCG